MGNGTGLISYGKGYGAEGDIAMKRALINLRRNIVAIPIDLYCTVTTRMYANLNGTKLEIYPRNSFNSVGHPMIGHFLYMTGLRHLGFTLNYRNINNWNLVLLYFKCVTQNITPKMMAEQTGRKVYHMNLGKKVSDMGDIPRASGMG